MRINGIPVEELLRCHADRLESAAASASASEEAPPAEPAIVEKAGFTVAGVAFEANLREIAEQELGTRALEKVREARGQFGGRLSDAVYLVQIYPMKPGFNPHTDAFTQLIGYAVPEGTAVPEGFAVRSLPSREYVKLTHVGLESELGRTYDLLYGRWMQENGRQPDGYDFEVWDDRYKPDRDDNEIDVYVALKP
ncbi:AraC family transcriptional regulator [Paenibacillus sp. IB182493]|uniref:AraC family transcriptional regulator n=2 Tax=Paenibacillus arenilitoris TaxID=2772299 RepID=A0A927CL32_9BACL|nr:AraC family transcriptional regulator [Paenibacillus arenilitoris]